MPKENDEFERRLGRLQEQLRSSKEFPKNKSAVLKFSDFCFSEGLGTKRVIKYIYYPNESYMCGICGYLWYLFWRVPVIL